MYTREILMREKTYRGRKSIRQVIGSPRIDLVTSSTVDEVRSSCRMTREQRKEEKKRERQKQGIRKIEVDETHTVDRGGHSAG